MGYLGSKGGSGVYQAVIAAMPPHDTYIETHLGSGVVMRAKPQAARHIGIDRDAAAISVFLDHLVAQTSATMSADVTIDARGYEVLAAGGIDAGRCAAEQIIRRAHAAATGPDLHVADAVAWLEAFDFAAAGRVLIYADPPYVLATRTAADRHRYRFDYTDADHRRLIAVLRQVPAAVIISGYPSALYDALLGDWRVIEYQAMTRGGPRTEQLHLNFPAGAVQWARFAGRDYKERQRIKRKAARWARMYHALPAGERLAILAALLAETPSA